MHCNLFEEPLSNQSQDTWRDYRDLIYHHDLPSSFPLEQEPGVVIFEYALDYPGISRNVRPQSCECILPHEKAHGPISSNFNFLKPRHSKPMTLE